MKKKYSAKNNFLLLMLPILTLLGIFQIRHSQRFVEAISPDVVISEIQIAGISAHDEFVELYNPTQNTVDLSGWRLSRRSSSISGSITNLVSSLTGTIQPHGFFLIANPNFTGSVMPDLYYSATTSGIAANNTVLLYRDNGQTLVDKIGMGTAEDVESVAMILPESLQSVERKPHQNATYETMNNGIDKHIGNGFDSDNNLQDFVLRTNPEPQNSQSAVEPQASTITPTTPPSPTLLPTEIPLPTETITPSNTPTPINTPIPTTTITPTHTPIPTLLPSPTEIISPTIPPQLSPTIISTPTESPTQFPTPSTTPQPSLLLTPAPTDIYPFPLLRIQCTWKQKTIKTLWITYTFQLPQCSLIRIER